MSDTSMELLGRAWKDEAFRKSLREDPHAALAQVGLEVPTDVSVTVHESTDNEKHMVLPAPQESPSFQCREYAWTVGCTFREEGSALDAADCGRVMWTVWCTHE